MYRKTGIVLLVFLSLMLVTASAPPYAQNDTPQIIVLEASGPVVPAFESYVTRGIQEADERNVEAVILVLDTPGGNAEITLNIVQSIRTSDVPVIVFVGPRGAKAGSAGLLITLAGHAAAMAPDTAIGASSPIGLQGEDLESTAEQKAKEFLSAEARSLAERRGEDAVQIANDAVTEAKAVSAREAVEANLVDFIVEDVDELLAQLDGFRVEVNGRERLLRTRDATLIPIPMSTFEQLLMMITNPNIIALLLIIGPLAIIIEIMSPGGWVLGTVGVICLGLGLYGAGVLPVNWLGLILIVLAVVLFVLEVKAPTHGILTAAGVASMAAGLIILFSDPAIEPFGKLSIPLVIAQSVVIGAIFFFLAIMALRAQHRQPTTGYEGLIGQTARVTQDLDPRGTVLVLGERWNAEAIDGAPIPVGSEVEIVEARNLRLRVRPRQTE
jgi:membrane-bound serine protease (ClpP class)